MTKASNSSNDFRSTEHGHLIPALREISAVDTVSITTGAWTAVAVPSGVNCRAVLVKTRAGNSWRLGTSDGASEYVLIDGVLELSIAQSPGVVLFYAKADTSNDTLEVVFFD